MTQRADQPLQDGTIEKIEELFESTGRVARRHFRGDLEALAAADKGGAAGYDPVTAADEEIEALLGAGGRAVAGWMDQPVLGETCAAVDGRAVVRRPAAGGGSVEVADLRASGCAELSEAILYTTHPSMFGEAGGEARRRYDELGLRV